MTKRRLISVAAACGLAVLWTLSACAEPAQPAAAATAPKAAPATPVFPPGSHIGLVPPPGMVASTTFPGFVDAAKNAAIVISVLPGGGYADMEKTLANDILQKQGITVEKREPIQVGIGSGDLIVGTQLAPDKKPYRKWLLLLQTKGFTVAITVQAPEDDKAYSDSVVRASLATLAEREAVPREEYLSLLPFKVGDFSGFHIANVIPGRALLLLDAPKIPHMVVTQGLPEYTFNGRLIVAAVPGNPRDPNQRADLARNAFNAIQGIRDTKVTMAEPVRIDNQEGFETVASAKEASTGANLMVVQWLMFGNTAFLQMVGISPADTWDSELARMRAVRDSVTFK